MADTYTQSLKARLIEQDGYDPAWATRFNDDFGKIVDAGIGGALEIDIGSATTYALQAMQNGTLSESHYWHLRFVGTPASAVTVTVPTSVTPSKEYLVENQTGQALTFKYAATAGVTIQDEDMVAVRCDGTNISEAIYQPRYKRTSAELVAGVTPANYAYPPGHILRYGTNTTPGTTDMLTAFQNAIASFGTRGGVLTIPPGIYRLSSTLTITTFVTLDGGNANKDGSNTIGAVLYSTANAPILQYNNTNNRFVELRNIAILGDTGAGSSQHGIVVANGGVHIDNVRIRACGGSGISGTFSYAGSYSRIYISLCTGDGININGNWGANVWENVTCAANGGKGLNVAAADGRDLLVGCATEQNTSQGMRFATGVKGWRTVHHYSELNVGGCLLFDSGSDHNKIQFSTWNESGLVDGNPVNNGGTGNAWEGSNYNYSINIQPVCIQRVSTAYIDKVTGTPNTIPYDDTIPQASEGLLVMQQTVNAKYIGSKMVVKARGFAEIAAGDVMTVTGYVDADTNVRAAVSQVTSVDKPVEFMIEFTFTSTTLNGHVFFVNVGTNTSGVVTFGGSGGARKFGGAIIGEISVEEYRS